MLSAQNRKNVISIPSGPSSAQTHTVQIDRKGFDHVNIDVFGWGGTTAMTSGATIALTVTESDTTDISNGATFSGFVSGTDYTAPTFTSTDSRQMAAFSVDCRARKRYLYVSVTPFTTTSCLVHASMFNADSAPNSASEAGALVFHAG